MTIYVDNKNIGTLHEGNFLKRVKRSKHLHRKTNAWGIDAEKFNNVIYPHVIEHNGKIKVFDEENKRLYVTNADNFKLHGIYLHFKPHKAQIFLPLPHWHLIDKSK